MSRTTFSNASIRGIAVTLGENKLCIDDELDYFDGDLVKVNRLKKVIGINYRYHANNDTTTADLCFSSVIKLLNSTNTNLSDIDGIISVTQTPDYNMPGNAHVLHGLIGLHKNTFAIDINSGCSGYIYGLYFAFLMISGGLKKILLVTGDTMSKVVNRNDKSEFPIFSDAGSATLVEYNNTIDNSYFLLESDGKFVRKMYQPAGAYRNRSSEETRKEKKFNDGNVRSDENFFMDGFEVFDKSLTEQTYLLNEIIDYSGKKHCEIDYVISHQSNAYIVDTIAKKGNFPFNITPNVFSKYGNQSSASIPCTICDCLVEVKNRNKLNVILHALGIGFSYGACFLNLNGITVLKPEIYKKGV